MFFKVLVIHAIPVMYFAKHSMCWLLCMMPLKVAIFQAVQLSLFQCIVVDFCNVVKGSSNSCDSGDVHCKMFDTFIIACNAFKSCDFRIIVEDGNDFSIVCTNNIVFSQYHLLKHTCNECPASALRIYWPDSSNMVCCILTDLCFGNIL